MDRTVTGGRGGCFPKLDVDAMKDIRKPGLFDGILETVIKTTDCILNTQGSNTKNDKKK